jgi:hypothetical protein
VLGDRCRQVLGDPSFGDGEKVRSHPLGSTLPFDENALSRSLVSVFCRDFDDMADAVAVAGNGGSRLLVYAVGPVFAGRQRCRSQLFFPVTPSSKSQPLTSDDLGVWWHWSSYGFLEDVAHNSLLLSPKLKFEICGEPVGHVEPDRLISPGESHDARTGNARFLLHGVV